MNHCNEQLHISQALPEKYEGEVLEACRPLDHMSSDGEMDGVWERHAVSYVFSLFFLTS